MKHKPCKFVGYINYTYIWMTPVACRANKEMDRDSCITISVIEFVHFTEITESDIGWCHIS